MNVATFSESLVRWLVASSWQLALFIAVVAIAAMLLKNAAPRLRHGLWLLVLVKALLPPTLGGPSLPAPWAAGNWAVAPVTSRLPDTARELVTLSAEETPPVESPAGPTASLLAKTEATSTADVRNTWERPSLFTMLAAGWLIGVVVVATALVAGYARVRRAISKLESIDEGPARVALERAAIAIGLPDADGVDLRLSETPAATFLIGVRRPTIVISRATIDELAPDELVGVFAHELVHWRRRDTLVGWLQAVVVTLYWFHPLVWWASTRLRDERERCCDDEVLRRSAVAPDRYGEAIVRSLTLGHGRPSGLSAPMPLAAAGMVGVFERGSALQQRMEDIMAFQPTRGRFGWPSLALLAAFAAVFVPLAGASIAAKSQGEVELVQLSLDDTSESGLKVEPDAEIKVEGKASTRVTTKWATTVCLAEIEKPDVEDAQLIYSAMVRSDLDQSASLEMWAHVDGGVYFSRNPNVAVFGKSDWKRLEIPFFFKAGQRPDKVTLNLIIGGPGTVWVDDIRLTKRPLNGVGSAAAGEKLSPVKKGVIADKAEKEATADLPYPSVIKTVPEIGATDVSPSLDEIRVTFDRDMNPGGMSWTGGGENFPTYDESRKARWINARTCVLPVLLEKGKFYRVGINAKSAQNFNSADGTPAAHAVIAFATERAKRSVANKVKAPEIVELSPPNGATIVPSIDQKEISVTFNTKMGQGTSIVKTGGKMPDFAKEDAVRWSKDGRTCTMTVTLKPGTKYELGINGSHAINFQSDDGVPAPATVWSFTTKSK
ncbi:M56 family metallopeptidase [Botrimarina mediterranea]|uniref:Regulatory protein BlaR1 n=1 Tax=Botrimarina mediterranea TaxID=2528022 RepID=A0A518KE45_9BACT|nr:M56 family metallopeptidase [Botrimarina mediterranea]QDV76060.1 Regulatory protein BlaR1 [Botrimarina mediterranea]